jgi:glycosyltransferase involved in cell wall biosynthesis
MSKTVLATHCESDRDDTKELPSLLVFADDWGRHPSSCQHLVKRLTNRFQVLWVNTIGTRTPKLDLFTFRRGIEKLKSWGKGLNQTESDLSVIDLPMLPWAGSRFTRAINEKLVTSLLRKHLRRRQVDNPVVLTTLPHVSTLVGDVGQKGLIYYCTDDYSQWPNANKDSMLEAELKTLSRSDLVLAVSKHLVSRCQSAKRCELFPHAVDFDHFARTSTITRHPDILKLPGPKIGFFGLLYEKIDYDLLMRVAQVFKEASLVLIGPIDYCPESIRKIPNVHLLGPKPYSELPTWLAGMDVLTLPYVMDEMIRQSNPLKLRECLATGKPTVSVEVPEARDYEPHVHVAKNHEEFLTGIKKSLDETSESSSRLMRQQTVQYQTWDVRADQLERYILSINSHSSRAIYNS